MGNPPLLHLDHINVTLSSDKKPLTILQDISLDFHVGESAAIIGPSGSGKTTLLMVCAGLQAPSNGNILFENSALPISNEAALTEWRQKNIGIVFQHFHLLPTNTALENVMLPLELSGDDQARSKAMKMLDAVGLSHRLDHLPGKLSGGEQQRVALARALARKPKLLLADEPTGNLDQATGRMVMDLLFAQAKEFGTTLILITHDEKLAAQCDRTIALRDGRVANA